MSFFVYRLLPPRASFPADITEPEAATMAAHAEYWRRYAAEGTALVFGPVGDPNGVWGIAIIETADAAAAAALAEADPAITTGLCTYEILPMLSAVLGGRVAA